MTDFKGLLSISIPLILSLFISWYASISIIKSSRIKHFFSLLIIGILFAYIGAFCFFKVSNKVTNIIASLHASSAFGVSIMVIVLIGILTSELFTNTLSHRARRLAKAFIILICLTGAALTAHVLTEISLSPLKITATLITATAALLWASVIFIRFHDLLQTRIMLWGIFFGIVATAGFGGIFIWKGNIPHIVGIIGINGVIVLLYLLILTFVIENRKKSRKQ